MKKKIIKIIITSIILIGVLWILLKTNYFSPTGSFNLVSFIFFILLEVIIFSYITYTTINEEKIKNKVKYQQNPQNENKNPSNLLQFMFFIFETMRFIILSIIDFSLANILLEIVFTISTGLAFINLESPKKLQLYKCIILLILHIPTSLYLYANFELLKQCIELAIMEPLIIIFYILCVKQHLISEEK